MKKITRFFGILVLTYLYLGSNAQTIIPKKYFGINTWMNIHMLHIIMYREHNIQKLFQKLIVKRTQPCLKSQIFMQELL